MPKIVDGVIIPFRSQLTLKESGIIVESSVKKSGTEKKSSSRTDNQYQPNLHMFMNSERSSLQFVTDEYGQLIEVERQADLKGKNDTVDKERRITTVESDPDTEMTETIISKSPSENKIIHSLDDELKSSRKKPRLNLKNKGNTIDLTYDIVDNDANKLSDLSSSVQWSEDELSDDQDQVDISNDQQENEPSGHEEGLDTIVTESEPIAEKDMKHVKADAQEYYESELAPFMINSSNMRESESKGENLNTFESIFSDTLAMYKQENGDVDDLKDFIVPDEEVETENLPYANFSKAKAIMDAKDPDLFYFQTVLGTEILAKLENDRIIVSKMQHCKATQIAKGLKLVSAASEFWLRTRGMVKDRTVLHDVLKDFKTYLETHNQQFSAMNDLETKFTEIWKRRFRYSYSDIRTDIWQSIAKELGKHI